MTDTDSLRRLVAEAREWGSPHVPIRLPNGTTAWQVVGAEVHQLAAAVEQLLTEREQHEEHDEDRRHFVAQQAARIEVLERVATYAGRLMEADRTYPERAKASPRLVADGWFVDERKGLMSALRDALAALAALDKEQG